MSEAWREVAACQGTPLSWWFPNHGVSPGVDMYPEARTICGRCPVTVECLEDAGADQRVRYTDSLTRAHGGAGGGFRAGLTASERDKQRPRRVQRKAA